MNVANELFFAGVIPLTVAAATALLLRLMNSPPPVTWAAGVALAYVAGQFALSSRRGVARAIQTLVSPREASEWLPLAVLMALGVTILASSLSRRGRPWVIGLAALLAAGVPGRLLAGHVAQHWSALEKVLHLSLLTATLALVWLLLAAVRDDELPRLRQVLLVLAAFGTAIVTTLSGSFSIGRLCGIVAAAVAGTALVTPRGLSGAAGVVTLSLGGLIIIGVFYARLDWANATLVLLSLVAAAGRFPEVVSVWPAWQRAALRAALCLIPLAIAIARCLA